SGSAPRRTPRCYYLCQFPSVWEGEGSSSDSSVPIWSPPYCSLPFLSRWEGQSQEKVPIVIVGNKRDLHHQRVVSSEEGRLLALSLDCGFYEVSAAEAYHGALMVFHGLAEQSCAGDLLLPAAAFWWLWTFPLCKWRAGCAWESQAPGSFPGWRWGGGQGRLFPFPGVPGKAVCRKGVVCAVQTVIALLCSPLNGINLLWQEAPGSSWL
uniref:small monomeric GTPase n=1 Tax=Anser cygnoides TaxID=8845 RepID=A0A8B9DW74_ANSCY